MDAISMLHAEFDGFNRLAVACDADGLEALLPRLYLENFFIRRTEKDGSVRVFSGAVENVGAQGNVLLLTADEDAVRQGYASLEIVYENDGFIDDAIRMDAGSPVAVSNTPGIVADDAVAAAGLLALPPDRIASLFEDVLLGRTFVSLGDGGGAKLILTSDKADFVLKEGMADGPEVLENEPGRLVLHGTQDELNAALANMACRLDEDAAAGAGEGSAAEAVEIVMLTDGGLRCSRTVGLLPETALEAGAGSAEIDGNVLSFVNGNGAAVFDANKTGNGDDGLCWAAAAADMLAYGGWTEYAAGDAQTDQPESMLFMLYRDSFSNDGSLTGNGLRWYFADAYAERGGSSGGTRYASAKAEGGFVGFSPASFRAADFRNLLSERKSGKDTAVVSRMNAMALEILGGAAAGLSLTATNARGVPVAGHAVACWGLECRIDLPMNDPEWLRGVWITDSDDAGDGEDVLRRISLEWNASESVYYLLDYFSLPVYWEGGWCSLAPEGSVKEAASGLKTSYASDADGPPAPKQYVVGGNAVYGTDVTGIQYVLDGSAASGCAVWSGGVQYVLGGASAGQETVGEGGVQYVSGASALQTAVLAGGLQVVCSGGLAEGCAAWGGRSVLAGGSALGCLTEDGGKAWIYGEAEDETVAAGGAEAVMPDGSLLGAKVEGTLNVFGSARDAAAGSGGRINVAEGGTAESAAAEDGGVLAVYSGGTVRDAMIGSGASFRAASGASIEGSLRVDGASARGGTAGSPLELSYGARLDASSAAMAGLHLAGNGVSYRFAGACSLGSLQLNGMSDVTLSLAGAMPSGTPVLSLRTSADRNWAPVSVELSPAQAPGFYRLARNFAAEGWEVSAGSVKAADPRTDGSQFDVNGLACRIVNAGEFVNMSVAIRWGWMKRGNEHRNNLKGGANGDIFWGGEGADRMVGGGGRDCIVCGTEDWGRDVAGNGKGSLAVVFKDLAEDDVVQSMSGEDMVFAKAAAPDQTLTVRKWNEATHSVVFAGSMPAVDVWLTEAAPALEQMAAARREVWQKAGLAPAQGAA